MNSAVPKNKSERVHTTLTINLSDRTRFKTIREQYSDELGSRLKVVPEFSIASFFGLILSYIESRPNSFLDYCFKEEED